MHFPAGQMRRGYWGRAVEVERGYLADGDLYASFYRAESAKRAILLLPAFGEERRSTHRYLCHLARTLARNGCDVLHIDLAGTGDSFGDLREISLADWQADAARAWELLVSSSAADLQVAMGLRLGANLALELPAARKILISPLLTGGALVSELIRRRLIKEMAGAGQASTSERELRRAWAAGEPVDLDGIWVSGELARGLEGLSLEQQLAAHGEGSITAVVLAAKATRAWTGLGDHLRVECVRERPIWGRLDYYAAPTLTAKLVELLEEGA